MQWLAGIHHYYPDVGSDFEVVSERGYKIILRDDL